MRKEVDSNIREALQKLPRPMINHKGIKVVVRQEARSETGEEHIAAKKHFLKVRDIEAIPQIIKNPLSYKRDSKRKRSMVYFGKRPGNNKAKYLKIVTNTLRDGSEELITVFPKKRFDKY